MRFYASTILAVTAVLAVASTASASDRQMNDSTYLAVARCAGLAQGVGADASPFTTVLDSQSGSRLAEVMDRADEAKTNAKRNAGHAGPDGKAGYQREVDGVCKSYIAMN